MWKWFYKDSKISGIAVSKSKPEVLGTQSHEGFENDEVRFMIHFTSGKPGMVSPWARPALMNHGPMFQGWIRFYSWGTEAAYATRSCLLGLGSQSGIVGSPWKVGKLRWKNPEAVAAAGAKAWCLQCLGEWCRFPMFFGRFSYASGEIQHPPRLDGFEEKK